MAEHPSAGAGRPPEDTPARPGAERWILGLLLALAIAWTLRATVSVTLPVAIAVIIALSVWPVSGWVQNRVPERFRWLGNVAALALVLFILATLVAGLALVARQIRGELPQSSAALLQKAKGTMQQSGIGEMLGGTEQLAGSLGKGLEALASYATTLLATISSTVFGLILVFFLVLLMLAEAGTWRGKLAAISGRDSGWDDVIGAIGQRFRHYFLARLALGLATGALYAAYLALFGVPLLLVWGLLTVILNFVPTVGSLISGILPVIYVAFTMDATTALLVAVGLLVIEQVMGNYVDPKVLGRQLAISPLVILISLLVWSWIWGIVGALIAVPMTVLLIVVFAHVPALRPVALLLSDERDMAGLEAHTRAQNK